MTLPTQLPLKTDASLPATNLQPALNTPLKRTLLLAEQRNVCQAVVTYLHTVFKEEPLLRSAAHTLCNYIH